MKKILALALAILMVLSLVACSTTGTTETEPVTNNDATEANVSDDETEGDDSDTEAEAYDFTQKKYVIGIAEAQANDEVSTRRYYLENYIASNYNVEFIFSETLKDDAATKTFIENCIDAGADAIIDFKSASGQMASLCEENGLVYTANGSFVSHPELLTTDYSLFSTIVGANNEQVGSIFGDWLAENASEDGSEGFLVSTSLASQGNTQHVEITRAILEGLQEKYGLTYTKTIDELIASSETTNVENDKDILITLYPGSPNKDTWLPGISTLLQTGNYGVFMSSGQTYNQSAQVVSEVETSFNMDIKVTSIGALGTTLTTAFNTADSQGNASVNMIGVKSVSCLTACLFAATYNALTGHNEVNRDEEDGLPARFQFNFIAISSAEQLAATEDWDNRDTNSWIADTSFVNQMLYVTNPDVTAQSISDLMGSVTYDNVASWMSSR